MKKQLLAAALLLSATFITPAFGIASRISRITSGALCCAAGIYALMQAKESYDNTRGIRDVGHKAKRGLFSLVEDIDQATGGQAPNALDGFYNKHKHSIHACGWGSGGITAIALGLKLIFK